MQGDEARKPPREAAPGSGFCGGKEGPLATLLRCGRYPAHGAKSSEAGPYPATEVAHSLGPPLQCPSAATPLPRGKRRGLGADQEEPPQWPRRTHFETSPDDQTMAGFRDDDAQPQAFQKHLQGE